MAFCYLMAIVIYLFYPVNFFSFSFLKIGLNFHTQESAGKTLEEMDYLFMKGRSAWVFTDKEATKIGAIFERDMTHGEALTVFEDKSAEYGYVEKVVGSNETAVA